MTPQFVQDVVSAGLTAAMGAMGQASDERFQQIEEDVGRLRQSQAQLLGSEKNEVMMQR